MENAETVLTVCIFLTGAITSVLVSYIKGIFPGLTKDHVRLLTAGLAFATSTGFLFLIGDISWQGLGVGFTSILGVSQLVYFGVMKTLKIDELLENE